MLAKTVSARAPGQAGRRVPTQQRARARVERMLAAAEELLVANGIANLKLGDVAERAGVPIGSVYEYFSCREDVLGALAERHYRVFEAATAKRFANIQTIEAMMDAVDLAIAEAWTYVRDNPGFREILCGVQAWEGLRELDWEDTMTNARIIAAAAAPFLPKIGADDVLALFLVVCDAAGSTARLSLHFGAYEHTLQKTFREMARNQFIELVRLNATR